MLFLAIRKSVVNRLLVDLIKTVFAGLDELSSKCNVTSSNFLITDCFIASAPCATFLSIVILLSARADNCLLPLYA